MILTARDAVDRALKNAGAYGDTPPVRIPTGFAPIDDVLGGLSPGEATFIGARPGCGKSTTALFLAKGMALRGHTVGFLSIEDTVETIGERIQAWWSGVTPLALHANGSQMVGDQGLLRALDRSEDCPILIGCTAAKIDKVIETFRALVKAGAKAIVFDYITKLRGTGDKRTVISDAIGELVDLAKHYQIPLVIASQLRRPEFDSKTMTYVTEPTMFDLAEASALEHSAEVLILIWRDLEGNNWGKIAKLKYGRVDCKFRMPLNEETGDISVVFGEAA